MASSTPHTIFLKLNGEGERTVFEETVVTTQLIPGEWCLFDTGSVKPGPTAADVDAPDIIVVEQAYIDPRLVATAAIDTPYAVAAKAKLAFPKTGDLLYSWLEDEGNVLKGAPLEHNGSGALQAYTSGKIVAYAAENKDNTGGSGNVRIRVWKA